MDPMAKLFGVFPERASDFVEFDIGNAIKFTLFRVRSSGSLGHWASSAASSTLPFGDIEVA